MSDARKPGDVHRLFVAAFNAGDLDALMRCFEPEACFVSKSGRVAAGADAVREAYRRTLANKPHMELRLDPQERAALMRLLIEAWDAETDEGVDDAWRVEIERRMVELDSGSVEAVPREEVRERLYRR